MTDRVFLSMDGLPMTRNSLAGIVGGLKRASGVKRLHARLFRHTFAVKYRMKWRAPGDPASFLAAASRTSGKPPAPIHSSSGRWGDGQAR